VEEIRTDTLRSRVTSGMVSSQIQRQAFLRCIKKTIGLLWFEKIVSSHPHLPDIPYYPYLASGNVDLHLTLVTSSKNTNDLSQAKPSYLYDLSTTNLYILLELNNPSILLWWTNPTGTGSRRISDINLNNPNLL
jgi:hypothetical protein